MRLIDTVIDGRYHIIEQLGEGGMSVVFRATDQITQQNVVLKLMKRNAEWNRTSDNRVI